MMTSEGLAASVRLTGTVARILMQLAVALLIPGCQLPSVSSYSLAQRRPPTQPHVHTSRGVCMLFGRR